MKKVNDLIKELSSLREDLRDLPVVVQADNGMMFEPCAKKIFKDDENPLTGVPVKMIITY